MTLQQIRYLEAVADKGSISKAAEALYVAQSSLSSAVKEVEQEFGIEIFERTSRGVSLTHRGQEFLSDIHFISSHYDHVDSKYKTVADAVPKQFCVSAHHHICGEEPFLALISSPSYSGYRFGYLEGSTTFVLDNVENKKSDIGVIFFTESAKSVALLDIRRRNLLFNHISYEQLHVYVHIGHPFAACTSVSLKEMVQYPYVTYDNYDAYAAKYTNSIRQWNENQQLFYVSDRATAYAILRARGAYATGSGYLSADKRNNDIVSVPVTDLEPIEVGWLIKSRYVLCEAAVEYVSLLRGAK